MYIAPPLLKTIEEGKLKLAAVLVPLTAPEEPVPARVLTVTDAGATVELLHLLHEEIKAVIAIANTRERYWLNIHFMLTFLVLSISLITGITMNDR